MHQYMPTMPSSGPQAPLALIHGSPSILAFKPKSFGEAYNSTSTLSMVSYIHRDNNEPMPWVPKRPLHQIGTKCIWRSCSTVPIRRSRLY